MLAVEDFDAALQIEKVKSPGRAFWIKPSGTVLNGAELLRFLLAEHEWMLEVNPDLAPQPDDVVIDCGAHVGTFADMALGRGASKVIAIEPDPTHVECLRRNFSEEIKNGRVIVIPKAVWSKPGTMKLTIGTKNSGMNSLVNEVGSQTIDVEVTTVDEIVAGLNLDRVDYIKMDIEGAEKEALKGAQTVISRFVPRLMLESNSTPEGVVEPSFVETIWPGYSMTAGACEPAAQLPIVLIPHVLYYYPQPRP